MRQAVLVAMAVALGACGGGVSPEDIDQQLARALCEHSERCGMFHESDCDEEQPSSYFGPRPRFNEALASGRLRFDEDAAERCLDFIRKASCEASPLTPVMTTRGLEYDDPCAFLQGQVAQGQPCTRSVECGTGMYCAFAEGEQCLRVCTPRPAPGTPVTDADACAPGELLVDFRCQRPLERGAACDSTDLGLDGPCAWGLRCAPQSHTCQPQRTVGDACGGDSDTWCGWSRVCFDGTCRPLRKEGESCNATSAGQRYGLQDCQVGLFCDADRGQRGVCRTPRAVGEACRGDSECPPNGMCLGARGYEDEWGTCVRLPSRGQPCTADRRCAGTLSCHPDTSTCLRTAFEGELCHDGVACVASTSCIEGLCRAPGGTCY